MTTNDWSFAVGYRFPLIFTRDAFAVDNPVLADVMVPSHDAPDARAIVYLDSALTANRPNIIRDIHAWFGAQAPRRLCLAATPEIIDGGEIAKRDLLVVERVAKTSVDSGLCRHSYVVIVGGGAVLDAVGFAASLIHRGLRQVRLPTTTLSQCDAGLGVKNAVNLFGIKNLIGTFTPPWAVIDDARFLESQDERTWRAGIAEAIKVAIIADAAFFDELCDIAGQLGRRDQSSLERVVRRCAELHLNHITASGDPFEQGSSRPLDYGHWSAHRLENLSRHRLQHGEAVAIGIALDSLYAAQIGRISHAAAMRILGLLRVIGFKLWDPCLDLRDRDGRRQLYAGLTQFREHLGGRLTLAMPEGIGRRRDVFEFQESEYEIAILQLKKSRRSPTLPVPSIS